MKVWAFALAALAAAVAAAVLIPNGDRPADVRSVATPAATDEPTPEATDEPSPSPSPTATAQPVAVGESVAADDTPEPERRRDRSGGRTTIAVVEGEHSEGCEGSLEDEEEEEEALEDCED